MKLLLYILLLSSLSSSGFAHSKEKHPSSNLIIKDGGEILAQKTIEPEKIEDIEEIKTVEEMKGQEQKNSAILQNPTDTEEPNKEQVSLLEFFGRLHPAMVHFPIAWFMLLLLIEMGTYVLPLIKDIKIGFITLLLSIISFIPAIATGLANASHLSSEDESLIQMMTQHRNFMFITFFVTLIALIFRVMKKNSLSGIAKWIYLSLIIIAAIIITFAADIGGQMVYGENYLF